MDLVLHRGTGDLKWLFITGGAEARCLVAKNSVLTVTGMKAGSHQTIGGKRLLQDINYFESIK